MSINASLLAFIFSITFLVACSETIRSDNTDSVTDLTEPVPVKENPPNLTESELSFLLAEVDKYPRDIKLLENEIIQSRLLELIGKTEYDNLTTWTTEAPIAVNDAVVTASACKSHSCSGSNYLLIADTGNDILHIGIRKNGEVKIYSEKNAESPKVLTDWADQPS